MNQLFWRKWHRWIGFPAALFLLLAAITGILLAWIEFFGADEALREHNRTLVSPVTLQSPAAQWSEPLAKAFANAAAHAGGAPVDSVTIAFKGDQPTVTIYTGKPTGGEDRKFVFDAKTGALLRVEAYTDKSFLLRLHSGEAFGDGGLVFAMFWGFALVLLTVSGIIIYLKMRRPGAKGLKKVFWLFALGWFAASSARADSPFYTDDPEFSPEWEIKAGITGEHNSGGSILTEVLDWNYAVVPKVRLNLTTYTKDIWPAGGSHQFGYGDTEFKVKWRFMDEDTNSWQPAIGIAPKIYFPTADKNRGLGDGIWRAQLPLQFGKTIGHFYNFSEAGYQWAFAPNASDVIYGGVGTLYSFNEHFALGTELFSNIPTDDGSNWQLLTTLGVVYTFNEHWAIKASISRTLRAESRGGPNPSGVFYLVWNF